MTNSIPSSGPPGFPTFTRLIHWLFSWRMLGRVLVGLGAFATLIALFYAEENWRGKHAWRQYRRQLEAKGEKLDWQAYVPSPVPDDQNFATTPFLAPLFDFNPDYHSRDYATKPFLWTLFETHQKTTKPGQSLWRDTNGYQRAQDFAKEIRIPGDTPAWPRRQFTDFQALLVPPRATVFPAKYLATHPESSAELRRVLKHYDAVFDGPVSPAKTFATRAEAAAELLRVLKSYDGVLEELRTASQRPHARFNINYTNEFVPAILLPHLSVVKRANMVFLLRAAAKLALDQTDEAWSDTKMALYLSDTIKDEPFMIAELVRNNLVQQSLQPIWEGLAARQWSEAQLREIEQRLGQIAILTAKTLRGELAFAILSLDQMLTQSELDWCNSTMSLTDVGVPHFLVPSGWFYQNQISLTQTYEELVFPEFAGPIQRIYPAKAMANSAILMKEYRGGFSPYRFLIKRFFFNEYDRADLAPLILFGAVRTFAVGQTRVNEAMVACALDRYRLANGRFPETLDALSPAFLTRIPPDLITGEPLKYRRTKDGQFILYSVGWNEQDDGGTVAMTQDKRPPVDLTRGDWVWQYPDR